MKTYIYQSIFFLCVTLSLCNSCRNDPFACKDGKNYPEVYTFELYTGSQIVTSKIALEVLYQNIANRQFPQGKFKYYEVHGGNLNVNYNPEKELLFARTGTNGFSWPHVYKNVTIEKLKNFKVPDDYGQINSKSGNYFDVLDKTFTKETDEIKIAEARSFLVTNLCK